jgi:hypothetical protein
MLYHHLGIFATGNLTDAEPEEHSFTVFLILVEVAKINVTIGVELDTRARALVVGKSALVDTAVIVYGHT